VKWCPSCWRARGFGSFVEFTIDTEGSDERELLTWQPVIDLGCPPWPSIIDFFSPAPAAIETPHTVADNGMLHRAAEYRTEINCRM
jgi:hypothetical protein